MRGTLPQVLGRVRLRRKGERVGTIEDYWERDEFHPLQVYLALLLGKMEQKLQRITVDSGEIAAVLTELREVVAEFEGIVGSGNLLVFDFEDTYQVWGSYHQALWAFCLSVIQASIKLTQFLFFHHNPH